MIITMTPTSFSGVLFCYTYDICIHTTTKQEKNKSALYVYFLSFFLGVCARQENDEVR